MAGEVRALFPGSLAPSGRSAELSALEQELTQAREGDRARFVFVRGNAGVGKSHLLRAFRARVSSRGVPFFEGDSPRESHRPYALFTALLRELLSFSLHAGVTSEQLSTLQRRLTPILREASPAEGATGTERLALYDAVVELFVLVSRERPVVVLPDLDVADPASLELVRFLASVASAPGSQIAGLFVATLRDTPTPPPALAELLRSVSARSLPLTGLDAEGIRDFLAREEVADRLLATTGGHPDALTALLEQPTAPLEELVLRRTARLPEASRTLLELLSLAPGAQRAESLTAAMAELGFDSAACAPGLDALARDHLLTVRSVDGGLAWRFLREPDQQAVRLSLAPGRITPLARALGHALAAQGELLGAARLLLAHGDPGEATGIATRAAEALAARAAHEEAEALHAQLLSRLPPGPAARETSLRMARSAAAQGRFKRALRHLGLARERSRPSAQTCEHARLASGWLVRLGRLALAERMLRLAERTAPLPATQAEILAARVELEVLRGRPDEALALATEVLPLLAHAPLTALEVQNAVGKAHLLRGDLSLADEAFALNAQQAAQLEAPHLEAQAAVNRGVVAHRRGAREQAIALYQLGLAKGRRPAQAQALSNLGSLHADAGDFELAQDHLSRALQAFSRLSNVREAAHAASNLSRLHHFLGELDRAEELSLYALHAARAVEEPYLTASALLNLGAVRLDRAEPTAIATLEEALEGFAAVGSDGYSALACGLLARAQLAAGARAQAQVALERKEVARGLRLLDAATLEVELATGELALALGDLLGAGKAVGRAREALLERPELEGPSRVYFLSARVRQAGGDAAGAQAELARAHQLLQELVQRVAPHRRAAFLRIPRRAELLAASAPDLRLPLLSTAAAGPSPAVSHGLVGRSPALLRVVAQLPPVARSGATVLIRGESGTGKERIADALHALSPRGHMPLVKVNCGAMVEELLLSELFGHEKGAFTGAVRERKGRFELAEGGTLFLDEIGDISPKAQIALLRVLQERQYERVGGSRTLDTDVRVICATHRDLEALIAEGRFRQDLYYRLKGVSLVVPPLRERPGDLPLLAEHVLGRVARERAEVPMRLSAAALAILERHSWPGNVREFENVLSAAAIFASEGIIGPQALAHVDELAALMEPGDEDAGAAELPERAGPGVDVASFSLPAEGAGTGQPLDYYTLARQRGMGLRELQEEMEVQCISRALADASGNISEAARLLGMKRSRLSQIVNAHPSLRALTRGTA